MGRGVAYGPRPSAPRKPNKARGREAQPPRSLETVQSIAWGPRRLPLTHSDADTFRHPGRRGPRPTEFPPREHTHYNPTTTATTEPKAMAAPLEMAFRSQDDALAELITSEERYVKTLSTFRNVSG